MKSAYLIAYYYARPRSDRRVRTNRAGWMTSDNVNLEERIVLAGRLKDRDISMSRVILDFANKKVVKNTFLKGEGFQDLFMYFLSTYPEETKKYMSMIDPSYLNTVAQTAQLTMANSQDIANFESVQTPVVTIDTSSAQVQNP